MHTNFDAAEGGVNDTLAGILGMQEAEPFAGGCGRVGALDTQAPLTVPALAALAQRRLGALCVPPREGPAVQVKYADNGRPVRRLAVISGAGGSLFEEALAVGADCLLTGEASHHAAIDAARLGLGTDRRRPLRPPSYPAVAALAARLQEAVPGLAVFASRENRDPFTYL